MNEFDARQESIRLIAHALEANDRNHAFALEMKKRDRFDIKVTIGNEAEYLAAAERILDAEIVRMAEERIMARIRADQLNP